MKEKTFKLFITGNKIKCANYLQIKVRSYFAYVNIFFIGEDKQVNKR